MTNVLTDCYYQHMEDILSLKEVIARNIALFREREGMDQITLGLAMGYKEDNAQSRISQYENLKRSPGKKTLQKIADIFQIPVGDLMRPWDSETEYRCLELYRAAKAVNALDEFAALLEGISKLVELKQGKGPGPLCARNPGTIPGKVRGSSA